MLYKTRGIVFRFTKYGETSIIVTIFTERFGLQGYIVNGVRSKSSKNKIALYQPLTLLDLVVYHRENANILRVKEVKCIHLYQGLHTDVRKSAVGMFINEILNKSVKDQSHAEEICRFLIDALTAFDQLPFNANFHLVFLIKLSRYLGFGPHSSQEIFSSWMLSPDELIILDKLLTASWEDSLPITAEARKNLLEAILHFYSNHLENMGEIRSVEVLKEVLR